MTFLVNGIYPSWTQNVQMLRPLVESGKIQLGNHTWSHPNLTALPQSKVSQELTRNDEFLKMTYGVVAKPHYRPPISAIPLSDSTSITADYIVKIPDQCFRPQAIVIGNLNHLPVAHVYPQLVDIIRSRNLRTVTLNDVFL